MSREASNGNGTTHQLNGEKPSRGRNEGYLANLQAKRRKQLLCKLCGR
jgi:hypothetical protein